MTEREFAIHVVQRLQEAGYQALWAGGCVRDEQLGLLPLDYDIATNAIPEQVDRLFRRSHSFGASFGVVEVLGPRDPSGTPLKVQVATFRSDGTYSDGRRPDSVTFSSAEEDAQRRDFTINGLFFDPLRGQVLDYVNGLADLKARVLRAIGDPYDRFREDKLRILRAVRMAMRFELTIDPLTLHAAQQMASQIRVVSPERIADELRKMFSHSRRLLAWDLLEDFQLLEPIFPELQAVPHSAVRALLASLRPPVWPVPDAIRFELVLAVILADVGPEVANGVAKRLKLSNAEADRLHWLVAHQAVFDSAPSLPPAVLYPLLVEPGCGELLALHAARFRRGQLPDTPLQFLYELLQTKPETELNPPPLLTGDDLKSLGLRPGPQFKAILSELRTAQLNGELTSRRQAEDWLRRGFLKS